MEEIEVEGKCCRHGADVNADSTECREPQRMGGGRFTVSS
jgi:hypothetical protein